jgi:hypothetical protein
MVLGFFGIVVGVQQFRRTGQRSFGRPPEVIADRDWQADQQLEEQLSDSPDYTFNTFLMGQRGTNSDGTHRQDIIAALAVGDSLTLLPEPTNIDQNAVAVVAAGGVIGYLPSKEAGELMQAISNETRARVTVDRLFDDDVNDVRVRAVWMHVELWGIMNNSFVEDKVAGETRVETEDLGTGLTSS